MNLSLVRHEHIYQAIKEEHEKYNYPLTSLCKFGNVSRWAYYKWLNRVIPESELKNQKIAEAMEKIHTIKYSNNGCTQTSSNPQFVAENILNRKFYSDSPNQKWLTDVTEFKYYINGQIHKLYLSAILDLYDRRIVSYAIGDSNNNSLVFETFDTAIAKHPNATPLFHSDRGFQYTNKIFHEKLQSLGIHQSMSRVGKCIDNGPMEGFWGILKRERYYGKKFNDKVSLITMIKDYIDYYNNKRLQRKLGVLTPMEKYNNYLKIA